MTNMEKIQLCQAIVNRIQEESKRPACRLRFTLRPVEDGWKIDGVEYAFGGSESWSVEHSL